MRAVSLKYLLFFSFVFSSYSALAELEVSGFADLQYKWIQNDTLNTGFRVNDGAFYLEHPHENGRVLIDIPFAWEGPVDTDGDNINDTYSNNFKFGEDIAQAYVTYQSADIEVSFGQFDTPFGYEANDSVDRWFTDGGIVFTYGTPATHTGLQFAYALDVFNFKLIAANVANQGAQGGNGSEYGLMAVATINDFSLSLGYLATRLRGKSKSTGNIMLSQSIGSYTVNVEFDLLDDPDLSKQASALLVHNVYQVGQGFSVGLRLEQLKNFSLADNSRNLFMQNQATLGFQYRLNPNIHTRLDYTKSELEGVKGTKKIKQDSSGFAVICEF